MKRISFGIALLAASIAVPAAHAGGGCENLLAERMSEPGYIPLGGPENAPEDEYLVGDWDGDGCDNIAVRRGNLILMDIDFDGQHDLEVRYGLGNAEDQYMVADFDADGIDEFAVRRHNDILMDEDTDGFADRTVRYGRGNNEDQYIAIDLDGDAFGFPDISIRRNNKWMRDVWPWDGVADGETVYGGGRNEDEYLVGKWRLNNGKATHAVRRGNVVLMNFNFDGTHDFEQAYGGGNNEDEYLVGDWDGDGRDNLAVRRGNLILMDIDFDGVHDLEQTFGGGTD